MLTQVCRAVQVLPFLSHKVFLVREDIFRDTAAPKWSRTSKRKSWVRNLRPRKIFHPIRRLNFFIWARSESCTEPLPEPSDEIRSHYPIRPESVLLLTCDFYCFPRCMINSPAYSEVWGLFSRLATVYEASFQAFLNLAFLHLAGDVVQTYFLYSKSGEALWTRNMFILLEMRNFLQIFPFYFMETKLLEANSSIIFRCEYGRALFSRLNVLRQKWRSLVEPLKVEILTTKEISIFLLSIPCDSWNLNLQYLTAAPDIFVSGYGAARTCLVAGWSVTRNLVSRRDLIGALHALRFDFVSTAKDHMANEICENLPYKNVPAWESSFWRGYTVLCRFLSRVSKTCG